MTMISDLPQDLVEEILARVANTSLGAVRSICKRWNALSRDRILCKTEPEQQFMGFMIINFKLCSMRLNLHGILNEDGLEFVDPSIKEIGSLLNNRVEISHVFHCDGLLLCVTRDNSRLVVWNPYLGQTRWINTEITTVETMYALGCDNNKNHKILRYYINNKQRTCEIYDLKSDSWRVCNVITNWDTDWYRQRRASVNGNTYFWTEYDSAEDEVESPDFLICFDFTTERFGQFLPRPFQHRIDDSVILTCVKEEKLAALCQHKDTSMIEIWITTKIEPNALSWTPFLKLDNESLVDLYNYFHFQFDGDDGSFFIDEEKKVAVVIDFDVSYSYKMAYIIGENGYLKKVRLGEKNGFDFSPMCCISYVPSLVQIDQIARQKKREKKRKSKSKRKENKRMKKVLTTTSTTRSKNTTSQKGNKKTYH